MRKGKAIMNEGYTIAVDGNLRLNGRWCVPASVDDLIHRTCEKDHTTAYLAHPGGDKMYKDLCTTSWWSGMKRDIADFMSKCVVCLRLKIEHK